VCTILLPGLEATTIASCSISINPEIDERVIIRRRGRGSEKIIIRI
jgi:hypothetical protein